MKSSGLCPRRKRRAAIKTLAMLLTLINSPVPARSSLFIPLAAWSARGLMRLSEERARPSMAGDLGESLRRRILLAGLRVHMSSTGSVPGGQPAALRPWSGIGSNVLGTFSGSNAFLHLSAAAGTFLIVRSGWDKEVHNFFAKNASVGDYSWPGVVLGAMFPAILGGGLLGSGTAGGSPELASAGSAVLQASLLAVSYSTALKALTGRTHPEPVIYGSNEVGSTFHFGFLRHGVFWGWPSGHMLANTAAVTSLLTFYRDKTWLKIGGGVYLGYLFLSVISHGKSSMHWFSDAVAGTLMGLAIGTTVGRDFRRRWEDKKGSAVALSFSAGPRLLAISFSLALYIGS